MNSSGDVDSYGAQFSLARRYDNGVFVDTQAQFNHFSNSADVRMLDGGKGHVKFSGNGYGLGMTLGYTFAIDKGYLKPYILLAGINEFADDNKARINNVTLNNSIDGAAFQIGIGAELKLNESISGYAGFDYTKGGEIERPWQASVGMGYSW